MTLCKCDDAEKLKLTKDAEGKIALDYAKAELETAVEELEALKKELKRNSDSGSESLNKEQLEAKEGQVAIKQDIVDMLSGESKSRPVVTENLHEID
jgi:hypothetical protein